MWSDLSLNKIINTWSEMGKKSEAYLGICEIQVYM